MVSEVARSMPPLSPVVPRQMLPPPTTTASSRPPPSMARAISLAMRSTVRGIDGLVRGRGGEGLPRHLEDDTAGFSHDPCGQAPMTTCANDTMRAAPSMPAMVCFSSLT